MNIRYATFAAVLFVIYVTAGAAQSLSGSNTVASDDIVDGQVYTTDIRDSTITGVDVKNSSLAGADIGDNSLKGADVDEGSLILPPGTAHSDGSLDPYPNGAGWGLELPDAIHLTKPAVLKLVVAAEDVWASCGDTPCTDIRVGLYVDGNPVPKSAVALGNAGSFVNTPMKPHTLVGVTELLPAGDHYVAVGGKPGNGTGDFNGVHVEHISLIAFE